MQTNGTNEKGFWESIAAKIDSMSPREKEGLVEGCAAISMIALALTAIGFVTWVILGLATTNAIGYLLSFMAVFYLICHWVWHKR